MDSSAVDFYACDFLCTYKQLDDDDLYRIQMLQAFKVNSWDDDEIIKKTDKLYQHVGCHFRKIFDILKEGNTRFTHLMLFMGDKLTDENLFRILFCMDLFQEAHQCFCDLITSGKISDENMDILKNAVVN